MQTHGVPPGGSPEESLCRILYVNSHAWCTCIVSSWLHVDGSHKCIFTFHAVTPETGRGRYITLVRTPLEQWSARRRDLYLTTPNTHNRETSITPGWFETKISACERLQTHDLDRVATGISSSHFTMRFGNAYWRNGCRRQMESFGIFFLHYYRDIHRQKWKRMCTAWRKLVLFFRLRKRLVRKCEYFLCEIYFNFCQSVNA